MSSVEPRTALSPTTLSDLERSFLAQLLMAKISGRLHFLAVSLLSLKPEAGDEPKSVVEFFVWSDSRGSKPLVQSKVRTEP